MKTYKLLLSATASAMALSQGLPAFSQEAGQQAQSGPVLEEVVVQARRVDENIQRVPIAVTAFTPETLQRVDVRNLYDLDKKTPSISICCGRGNAGFIFFRGIQGVVQYFADVPISGGGGNNGNGLFFDVGSVQVLKGPQGTLFGIASNGGAVVYQPRKPTDNFEGYVTGSVGNYNRRTIEGAINIPVNDKLLTRLSAQFGHINGYIRDVSNNKDLGDENYWVGRFSAVYRPTDDLENYLVFNYSKSHGNPEPFVPYLSNPNGLARSVFGAAAWDSAIAQQQALGKYKVVGLNAGAGAGGVYEWNWQINIANTTTWNITDNLSLKNVFGYQLSRGRSVADTDGTPFALLEGSQLNGTAPATPVWSDEIQLQGKAFSDRLDFQVGTFHTGTQTNPIINYSWAVGTLGAAVNKTSSKSRAVYGQGTWDFGEFIDGLKFTAGYRYTWDTRGQVNDRLTVPTLVVNRHLEAKRLFKAGSYTFSLNYQVTPDTMVYVTNSKGYSSGGLALTAPPAFQQFFPESLNNIEVGVKSDYSIGNVRARTNIAGWYGFYDNIQVSVTSQVQVNPPPAPPSLLVVTQNAAKGRIAGIELEQTILPTDDLEINAGFSYMKNRYTSYPSFDSAGNPIDLSSTQFVFTPKWKLNLSATYHLPVDESIGDLSVTADFNAQPKLYNTAVRVAGPADISPGFENLNLSVGWQDIMGTAGLSGTFFVNNVTENTWANGQFGAYGSLGLWGLRVAAPRMFGARLRYDF